MLGEITLATPFSGYTNREESEKKILHNVLREGDAYYRTCDMLKQDADGHYYFLDRIGDTYR